MKVLFVLHHFLPEFPSGVEVYTYHLAQELKKRHEIVLFFSTVSPDTSPDYTVQDGIFGGIVFRSIVNRGQKIRSFSETYQNSQISAIFRDFLDVVRPDIVHVHHLLNLSIDILHQLGERGIPVVFTLHDFWLQCPLFTRLKSDSSLSWAVELDECARCAQGEVDRWEVGLGRKALEWIGKGHVVAARKALAHAAWKRALGWMGKGHSYYLARLQTRERVIKKALEDVSLFLSPSRFLLEEFLKWGLPRAKIRYSPYGHKIIGGASGAKQERPRDKVRYGFVGSIVPHKGLHVLVEAFRGLDGAAAELHIFGGFYDPSYKRRILALAGADARIVFHGRFLPHALAEVYAQFDVQVVPSIWFENSPLTINEAFINKTPVITGNIGGMQELVDHGVNGLTFNVGDPVSLRERLHSVVRSPDLIADFAKRIPRIKTIEENAIELEGVYARLVNTPGGA